MSILNEYIVEFKDYDTSEIASVNIHAQNKREAAKLANELKRAIKDILDAHYRWNGWRSRQFKKTIITQQ